MTTSIPRTFYAGVLLYAVIFALGRVPLFETTLSLQQLGTLMAAAGLASGVVMLLLLTGLSERIRDPGAGFTQALLGIVVSTGLYAYIDPDVSPLILIVGGLWVAASVAHLSARRTLALQTVYFALYTYAAFPAMIGTAGPAQRDSVYGLVMSLVFASLLYWRVHEYEHHHDEKAATAGRLEEAAEHVRTLTTYDPDTTALKQSYFVAQVLREKVRVDHEGGTFSMGLIEIDDFPALAQRLGQTASKQLLREFSERASKKVRETDVLNKWPRTFQPLGRLSEGRFGLLLPATNYEDAMECAQRLHEAVDFKSIRTAAGVVGITLSIGITEHVKKESLEEVMRLSERALTLAKAHNGNDFRGLKRASAA